MKNDEIIDIVFKVECNNSLKIPEMSDEFKTLLYLKAKEKDEYKEIYSIKDVLIKALSDEQLMLEFIQNYEK